MDWKLYKSRNIDEGVVRLDDQEMLKSESFWYLGSIIHMDGEIEETVKFKSREDEVEKHIKSIVWLYNTHLVKGKIL